MSDFASHVEYVLAPGAWSWLLLRVGIPLSGCLTPPPAADTSATALGVDTKPKEGACAWPATGPSVAAPWFTITRVLDSFVDDASSAEALPSSAQ